MFVYAGQDPLTGKDRRLTGTAQTGKDAERLRTRLLGEIDKGARQRQQRHRGAGAPTLAGDGGPRVHDPARHEALIATKILPALAPSSALRSPMPGVPPGALEDTGLLLCYIGHGEGSDTLYLRQVDSREDDLADTSVPLIERLRKLFYEQQPSTAVGAGARYLSGRLGSARGARPAAPRLGDVHPSFNILAAAEPD
ncbi:MAG: hypothetical protein ACRDYA_12895 [Egibacteraceae bacterium]